MLDYIEVAGGDSILSPSETPVVQTGGLITADDYSLDEAFIITAKEKTNIKMMMVELSYYEDIFKGITSGKILINDSISLIDRLGMSGFDYIKLKFKKSLTSEAAYYLSTNVRKFQLLFDGLVFTGRNDGRVLVLFETTLASPLQYVDTRGLQQGDKFEWTSLKNKDSYGLGKDKRGMNKLDNYIKFRPSDIVFSELKDKDKKDFVKAKVKSNVPMQQDEYLFWVNETTPAPEELEKINDRMVSIKGNALEFMVNPSEAVIKKALYTFPRSIQYLDNPTEEQQLTSINNDPSTFQFIKNPTDTVVEEVLAEDVVSEEVVVEETVVEEVLAEEVVTEEVVSEEVVSEEVVVEEAVSEEPVIEETTPETPAEDSTEEEKKEEN